MNNKEILKIIYWIFFLFLAFKKKEKIKTNYKIYLNKNASFGNGVRWIINSNRNIYNCNIKKREYLFYHFTSFDYLSINFISIIALYSMC